jgi:hypothetical protein
VAPLPPHRGRGAKKSNCPPAGWIEIAYANTIFSGVAWAGSATPGNACCNRLFSGASRAAQRPGERSL